MISTDETLYIQGLQPGDLRTILLVFEYKGFFSSVNRKGIGKYLGKVTGVTDTGLDIEATSICQLRQLFEAIVDEYLQPQACALKNGIKKKKKDLSDGPGRK